MSGISPDHINKLCTDLDSLTHTMDSLAKVSSTDTTDYNTKTRSFFAKSTPLALIGSTDKHAGWLNKTLDGFHITQDHTHKTLEAALHILSDADVDQSTKQEIADKVSRLHQSLVKAEKGMLSIQKGSAKDQKRNALLTRAMVNFKHTANTDLIRVESAASPFFQSASLPQNSMISLGFDKPLDKLPPSTLKHYTKVLREEVNKTEDKRTSYLDLANHYFFDNISAVQKQARELHTSHSQTFAGVIIDKESKSVIATQEQFKIGQDLLYKHFPGHTASAHTEQQRIAVSELLQILLGGESLDPTTEYCVRLAETQKKSTPYGETGIPSRNSFALRCVEVVESRRPQFPTDSEMRNSMSKTAIGLTLTDITASHRVFIHGKSIPLNFTSDPFSVILPHLKESPTLAAETLAKYQAQGIVPAPSQTELSIFPEEHFVKAFEKYLKAALPTPLSQPDEQTVKVRDVLIDKLKAAPFSNTLAAQIAEELQIEKSQVEQTIAGIWPKEAQTDYNQRFAFVQNIIEVTTLSGTDKKLIAQKAGCTVREAEPLLRLIALDALITAAARESDKQHFSKNLKAILSTFCKDCINRQLNTFACGEISKKIGVRDQPSFFQEAGKMYLEHLTADPLNAASSAIECKDSDLLAEIQTQDLPFNDTSLFSEETFLALLEPHFDNYQPAIPTPPQKNDQQIHAALIAKIRNAPFQEAHIDEIAMDLNLDRKEVKSSIDRMWTPLNRSRHHQLMEAIVHSRIPGETLKQLAQTTGRPKKEIEPLVRFKFLQMMLLMNQSVQADFTNHTLTQTSMDFQHPLDHDQSTIGGAKVVSAVFRFPPDFRSLTYESDWEFQANAKQFELEGRPPPLDNNLFYSVGQSRFIVPDMNSNTPPKCAALTGVAFSWNSPIGNQSHLAGLINPDPLNEQFIKSRNKFAGKNWTNIELKKSKRNEMKEQTGFAGVEDLVSGINQALSDFRQWSNADNARDAYVTFQAAFLIDELAAIAKEIPDSPESNALSDHIDHVVGELLQIQEQRLDRMIWPIEQNPGRDLVSLDYACRLATANDCQFLNKERAIDLKMKIEVTLYAFTEWNSRIPEGKISEAETRKEQIQQLLRELQNALPKEAHRHDYISKLDQDINEYIELNPVLK